MGTARAELESLLRARKLDVTLTTASWRTAENAENGDEDDDDRLASTGWPGLDAALGGGLRRGQVSEVIGARSSGRSTLFCSLAAAATARGEVVALVDTHDRFDPGSAAAAGVDLGRLLWIRDSGNPERALKAMNLVLQAGGFGLVGFDLSDVRGIALRQFPHTTWLRLSRAIEGSVTVAVLIGSEHIARSPGGVTVALESPPTDLAGVWSGATPRARRLSGLTICPRVRSARAGEISPAPAPPRARDSKFCPSASAAPEPLTA